MADRYSSVARRAEHRCEYCRAPEAIFNFPFEVEHIVPQALDGSNEEFNLALSCRSCNVAKSNHLEGIDPKTGNVHRLFNPRADVWEENFEFEAQNGELRGRTAIGRTTIDLLRMNRASQKRARNQWMKLNLFP